MKKIAIIGCGNLGNSIVKGILDAQFIHPTCLTITKRNIDAIQHYKNIGVHITTDNQAAIMQADVIILAVKPYQLQDIIANVPFRSGQVVISVVTGICIADIRGWVGNDPVLFRAMPNTAISIKESMTCICYNEADESSIAFVKGLFEQLGKAIVIEEKLMDAATVLAACGTAYAMRYIRANIQGGVGIGFSVEQASYIASQTVKGAAALLLTNKTHPEQEIDKVATPKGCTIAGLNEMEHQGFSSSLIKGINESFKNIPKT